MAKAFIKIQNKYINVNQIAHVEVEKINGAERLQVYTVGRENALILFVTLMAPSDVQSVKQQLDELTK